MWVAEDDPMVEISPRTLTALAKRRLILPPMMLGGHGAMGVVLSPGVSDALEALREDIRDPWAAFVYRDASEQNLKKMSTALNNVDR